MCSTQTRECTTLFGCLTTRSFVGCLYPSRETGAAAELQALPLPGKKSAKALDSDRDKELVRAVAEHIKSDKALYEAILLYKVCTRIGTRTHRGRLIAANLVAM
jgi:hypothetical protein